MTVEGVRKLGKLFFAFALAECRHSACYSEMFHVGRVAFGKALDEWEKAAIFYTEKFRWKKVQVYNS